MVAKVTIKVDYAGVGDILKGDEVQDMVTEAAMDVAANIPDTIDGETVTSEVYPYTTDRSAAAVVMEHPFAAGFQAKYGTLTQAAGAAGFEVSSG